MRFEEVAGYEEVKVLLRDMQQTGRVPHALLFTGDDGSGAWHLAWAFAAYLNCLSPTAEGEPCGHCSSCIKYQLIAHPDLFLLFPIIGGDKLVSDDYLPRWRELVTQTPYFTHQDWLEQIKAGNSRPIIYSRESEVLDGRMGYRIAEAKYRVLMIWQPERMHETLSNKLLKLIEEPPEHTLIFMVSIAPQRLLSTIISRTQRIDLPRPDSEALYRALRATQEYASIHEENLRRAAHLAQGSYKRAVDMLNGKEATAAYLSIFEQFLYAASHTTDLSRMKELAEAIAALGREEQLALLSYISHLFRECYIYNLSIPKLIYLLPSEEAIVSRLIGVVTGQTIRTIQVEIESAIQDISRNVNSKIVSFDLLLHLTAVVSPAMKARGIVF